MNKFITDENTQNMRLDKALVLLLPDLSRTYISKLIDQGNAKVNDKVSKGSYKLRLGDTFSLDIPELKPLEVKKENIELDIVYEDDDILIINKPQGMVVHPAPGHYEHTLVNAILNHCGDNLSGINGVMRPGIVHRIDKDTSGLICVTKNDKSHRDLAEQLKTHKMARTYMCLVKGVIKENHGVIDLPIGRSRSNRQKMEVSKENSKEAKTYFDVIKRYSEYTLVECHLVTGRTHQIRVHMSYIGHPIEGDTLYNKRNAKHLYDKGQLLTAYKLHLIHPTTKKEMDFEIPLPKYFLDIIADLN